MPKGQSFEIKLGDLCNNNCLVCYLLDKKASKNKSLPEINKELGQIRKQHSELIISGGEPTVRKDIIKIIEHTNELKFHHITLMTNGRMLSYADYCKKIVRSGIDCFEIYLYGHSSQLHDSITGVLGSFNQTVQGIRNLKELNQYVTVNVIITEQNYEQLSKIVEFLINLNVDLISLEYVNPKNVSNKNNIVEMSQKLMDEINKSLDLKFEKYNWDGHIFVKELPAKSSVDFKRKSKTLDEIKMIKNKFQEKIK